MAFDGLKNFIKTELIDIIEWLDEGHETIAYRFERHDNEIKNKAKLIVRESQVAVFVNEGKFADVFKPGTYELTTENMPILTTLKGWKYGFDSPFKAEVYFVNTKLIEDLKWGTPGPVNMSHPDYFNIQLTAYGSLAIEVKDPIVFLEKVVGTDGEFMKDEISERLRDIVVSNISPIFQANVDNFMGMNYNEISGKLKEGLLNPFDQRGINLHTFNILSYDYDEETKEQIKIRKTAKSKKAAMDDLGANYMQYQTGESIENMSENPGGGGGGAMSDMMGAGMGFAFANQMAGSNLMGGNQNQQPNQGGQQQQNTGGTPPPLPPQNQFFVAVNGQQTGPFGTPQLQEMINKGELKKDSMIWKQGMAAWTAAGEVEDVSGLFGATPPPLPPQ